jgi:hypothetical protein
MFSGYNDYYVGQEDMNLPENTSTQACFRSANNAEWSMCNAQEYMTDALSFSPTEPHSREERLHKLRAAMYWLYYATVAATWVQGYHGHQCSNWQNESYQSYLINILTEIPPVAEIAAVEGGRLAIGLSDDYGQGRYEDKIGWIWGNDGRAGHRAIGLAFLYGRPWDTVSQVFPDDEEPTVFWQHTGYPIEHDVMPVIPSLAVKVDRAEVVRAMSVLQTYGVPIAGRRLLRFQFDNGAREFLVHAVNEERRIVGLSELSYEELLEELRISSSTLDQAEDVLVGKTQIYLMKLTAKEEDGFQYITGFGNPGINVQEQLVGSFSGLFYGADGVTVTEDFTVVTASNAGLQSIFALFQSSGRCIAYGDCDEVAQKRGLVHVPGMAEALEPGLTYVEKAFGGRSVTYKEMRPAESSSDPGILGISVERAGVSDPSDLVVYKVNGYRTPGNFGGVGVHEVMPAPMLPDDTEYYRLLACIYHDHDIWGSGCEFFLSGRDVGCDFTQSDTCEVELWGSRGMFVVAEGNSVIDVYAERNPNRPSEVHQSVPFSFWSRHFIGESTVRHLVRKTLARRLIESALPAYNSLGLPYDLAVPVENELTQGTSATSYEDSYVYYVERAIRAAENAGQLIKRAWEGEKEREVAEMEVANQRQDALDRIEQICGVGEQSCAVERV